MSACKTTPSACYLPHLIVCFAAGIGAVVSELALQDKVQVKSIERVHFPDSPRIARQASESCDVNVYEEEGWLFSPNYPSNYGNQQSCSFVVQRWRRDVCQVQLTLMDFDLDDTNGCFGDYLDISDGSPSVPGGGKLCGSLATGTKKTLTFSRGRDSMTLRFQSDARSTRKGFMIKVNQLVDSCDRRPDPFDNDALCDQQVSSYESVLRSPGYPNWYPKETRCRYTLRRPDSTVCRVELNFVRFEVEYSPGCRNDFLELPGGNRLCGNVVAPSIVEYPPGSNTMNILFSSDLRGNGPGFEVVVRQVPNSCGRNPPRPIPPGPYDDDCDRQLRGPSDRVVLRTSSSNWSRPRRCRFSVRRYDRSVCRVVMVLERFELDSRDKDCNWEYLQLPDGTRLCGTLSGRKTLTFPRGDNSLTLEYVNDRGRSGRSRGLQLFLDQVSGSCSHRTDDFCDQELSGYESRATSPDFPAEYGPNKRCHYYLRRADPTVCLVDVDFYFFDLERGRDLTCQQDYLEMPDGTKLCGIVAGQRVYKFPSGSGTFQMVFNSDHYGRGKGFDVRVRQRPNSCDSPRPGNCDVKINAESQVIRSPGYPSSYTNSLRCIYTVQRLNPDTCQVRMDFVDFDLDGGSTQCFQDYLEVEHTGERICGNNQRNVKIIPFPANTDSVLFVFKTDAVRSARGFEIRLTQIRGSCFRGAVDPEERLPICGTVREYTGVLQSGNYPLPYAPDQECLYRVLRASPDVCRIEMFMDHFEVGSRSDSLCLGDYLEVAGARYCGQRDRQTVRVDFPPEQNELTSRFKSDSYGQHPGFRIEVRQLISGCGGDVTPANRNCGATFEEEIFDLTSPGFRNGSYPSNEDCRYLVRKKHNDVCALQVKYNAFDLQQSSDCDRDFLEISDQKVCGKLPLDTTRTYEFPEDTLTIRFRSDNRQSGAGFFLTVKQVQC